jgi:hypothetical protein
MGNNKSLTSSSFSSQHVANSNGGAVASGAAASASNAINRIHTGFINDTNNLLRKLRNQTRTVNRNGNNNSKTHVSTLTSSNTSNSNGCSCETKVMQSAKNCKETNMAVAHKTDNPSKSKATKSIKFIRSKPKQQQSLPLPQQLHEQQQQQQQHLAKVNQKGETASEGTLKPESGSSSSSSSNSNQKKHVATATVMLLGIGKLVHSSNWAATNKLSSCHDSEYMAINECESNEKSMMCHQKRQEACKSTIEPLESFYESTYEMDMNNNSSNRGKKYESLIEPTDSSIATLAMAKRIEIDSNLYSKIVGCSNVSSSLSSTSSSPSSTSSNDKNRSSMSKVKDRSRLNVANKNKKYRQHSVSSSPRHSPLQTTATTSTKAATSFVWTQLNDSNDQESLHDYDNNGGREQINAIADQRRLSLENESNENKDKRASDRENVKELPVVPAKNFNPIEEFNYHVDLARQQQHHQRDQQQLLFFQSSESPKAANTGASSAAAEANSIETTSSIESSSGLLESNSRVPKLPPPLPPMRLPGYAMACTPEGINGSIEGDDGNYDVLERVDRLDSDSNMANGISIAAMNDDCIGCGSNNGSDYYQSVPDYESILSLKKQADPAKDESLVDAKVNKDYSNNKRDQVSASPTIHDSHLSNAYTHIEPVNVNNQLYYSFSGTQSATTKALATSSSTTVPGNSSILSSDSLASCSLASTGSSSAPSSSSSISTCSSQKPPPPPPPMTLPSLGKVLISDTNNAYIVKL